MAQALVETIFDILYLTTVIFLGVVMFRKGRTLAKKFGLMAIVLGAGDAFHLVPRVIALWTTGLEANAALLGMGKFITSITMTAFYLILYYIWRERYQIKGGERLTYIMWGLTLARIVLCILPQNDWFVFQPPVLFGVLRNIPFAIMGVLIIILFYAEAKRRNDEIFRYMWLAVTLSFAFYIPVVLFASIVPLLGMLMIPKTLAYVWIVLMGWRLFQQSARKGRQNL